MPEACILAKYFAKRFPYRCEDLYGEAMEGLVAGVELARIHLYDNNILPYVRTTIRHRLQRFCDKDFTVPIPHGKVKELIQKGELPKIVSIDHVSDEDKTFLIEDYHGDTPPDSGVNYCAMIEAMKLAPYEMRVLNYIMDGLKQQDVADQMNKSVGWVNKIIQRIRAKARLVLKE